MNQAGSSPVRTFAFRGSWVLLVFASWGASPALGQDARLGQFEGRGDIGSPQLAGSATYNAASQEYVLSASGLNMWAKRDEFQFVWRKMTGDFMGMPFEFTVKKA